MWFYRQVPIAKPWVWMGNYKYVREDGVAHHICAVGKSEKHAKTMLLKKLKNMGISVSDSAVKQLNN